MPGEFLLGPLARAWKALNDYAVLRKSVAGLTNVGNSLHKSFESEGDDSKTPNAIEKTKDFIDDADDEFFPFVNLMDAHLPYHSPEEYREPFAPGVDPNEVCQDTKLYNTGAYEIDERSWKRFSRCTTPRSPTWNTTSGTCSSGHKRRANGRRRLSSCVPITVNVSADGTVPCLEIVTTNYTPWDRGNYR
nr:hypothetical protein [Halorhabdus rudnickae]